MLSETTSHPRGSTARAAEQSQKDVEGSKSTAPFHIHYYLLLSITAYDAP